MPARVRRSRSVVPWLQTLLGVAGCLALATVLFALDLRIEFAVPLSAVLGGPVGVYAVLVFIAQPRFRFWRYLGGVGVVTLAHGGLLLVASVLEVTLESRAWTVAGAVALGTVVPMTVVLTVFAPLALAPHRHYLAPPPPTARRRPAASRIAPRGVEPEAPAASAAAATSKAAPAAPAAAGTAMGAMSHPAGGASAPAAPAIPGAAAAANGQPDRPRADEAPADLVGDETVAPDRDGCVAVRFERLAGQLPVQMFALPLEEVAAALAEPGRLLVARDVVLPQLAAGVVRVPWDAVAGQFPRRTLALAPAELHERLADGLVLPLDEIIPQLPSALFATTSSGFDAARLEDFPLPFQPAAPSTAETAPAFDAPPAPVVPEDTAPPPDTVAAVTGPVDDGALEAEPAGAEPVAETAGAAAPVDRGPWDPDGPTGGPTPIEPGMGTETPAAAVPEPAGLAAHGEEARRIAASFGPGTGALAVDVHVERDVTFYLLLSPRRARSTVARAAMAVLDAVAAQPWSFTQVSLRGTQGALIVTPLGPFDAGGPVLVAAPAPGATLALLEMLALRAAGGRGSGGPSMPPPLMPADAEFRSLGVGLDLGGVAASLGAFGPVAPTVLEDDETGLAFYLFTVPPRRAATLARLARTVYVAAADGAAVGALASIAFRFGDEQVLVTPLADRSGRPALLVAGGTVARPGLARLQLARAAALVAAATN